MLWLPPCSGATAEDDLLRRLETVIRRARAIDERQLADLAARLSRVERTTRDLRGVIERIPAAGSTDATTGRQAANLGLPVCPPAITSDAPPGTFNVADEPDRDAVAISRTHLVAAGTAALVLFAALLWCLLNKAQRTSDTAVQPTLPSSDGVRQNPAVWLPRAAKPRRRKRGHLVPRTAVDDPAAPSTQAAGEPSDREPVAPSESTEQLLPLAQAEPGDEKNFDPTLELADIMLSMGLSGNAASALEEHIRANPRETVAHWLKLLDVYRKEGHRSDFEKTARDLQKHFNIRATDWLKSPDQLPTLEDFSRVIEQIRALCLHPRQCLDYLHQLLADNREGMRAGFPEPVAEEILLLIGVLKLAHPDETGDEEQLPAPPTMEAG